MKITELTLKKNFLTLPEFIIFKHFDNIIYIKPFYTKLNKLQYRKVSEVLSFFISIKYFIKQSTIANLMIQLKNLHIRYHLNFYN